MNAIAPGKVILSGEHSVVYGAPAIAMAVSESIQARFSPDNSQSLTIDSGEGEPFVYPLARLPDLQQQLNQRYGDFEAGLLPVDKIMDTPQTLLLYALSHFDYLPAGTLTTASTLPTGAGMGSSAAAIAATLVLAEQLSGHPLSLQERFSLVRYCERLQHGRGSAIDAAAVTHGGLIQVQNAEVIRLECHLGAGWYRINSGRPVVSTGECVAAVREAYGASAIWSEFADITQAIPEALNQPERLTTLLRANHQLLRQIGVVPAPVTKFIAQVEQLGGAAKISGAGANRGEQGGLILVYLPDSALADLRTLSNQYNYQISALTEDREGARSI
ncbi:mevalonate kinase [Pontibacterium granulatum]|uniref:mevalonate kinase family protein n=1 Tax=Pontibacterium granulatum TaxID=2036029 RepID=UPI00249A1A55|nr:mevalonate kinase [Pontibacterium granulatum]MDI3323344.1 mevalonate kinase [Pontibacterium granulatum]